MPRNGVYIEDYAAGPSCHSMCFYLDTAERAAFVEAEFHGFWERASGSQAWRLRNPGVQLSGSFHGTQLSRYNPAESPAEALPQRIAEALPDPALHALRRRIAAGDPDLTFGALAAHHGCTLMRAFLLALVDRYGSDAVLFELAFERCVDGHRRSRSKGYVFDGLPGAISSRLPVYLVRRQEELAAEVAAARAAAERPIPAVTLWVALVVRGTLGLLRAGTDLTAEPTLSGIVSQERRADLVPALYPEPCCPVCLNDDVEGASGMVAVGECGHGLCVCCAEVVCSENRPRCPLCRKPARRLASQCRIEGRWRRQIFAPSVGRTLAGTCPPWARWILLATHMRGAERRPQET